MSGSRPSGEVTEVNEQGDVSAEPHNGNTVKPSGESNDSTVHVGLSGNDVATKAPESKVGEKANVSDENAKEDKDEPLKENGKIEEKREPAELIKTNGEANLGEKHARDVKSVENGTKEVSKDVEMKDSEENGNKNVENGGAGQEVEAEEEDEDEEPATKKQKIEDDDKGTSQEGEKKGRGRPKRSDLLNGKASAKKKESRPPATADGKPRRSSRLGG